MSKTEALTQFDQAVYKYAHQWFRYPSIRLDFDLEDLAQCQPIYKTFPGWEKDTSNVRAWEKLPLTARRYLKAIAGLSGAKLKIVSVGPARDQTMFLYT